MRTVHPEVFLIAQTTIDWNVVYHYLKLIGAENWATSGGSGAEALTEFMGRLCYRSWQPGLNPNVTKVREGNDIYIKNILQSGHGSVLEHSSASFIFANVSRVFTHEVVRHRVGVAISQESLRYVRLEEIPFWMPSIIFEDEHALSIFTNTVETLEKLQKELAQHFKLDDPNVSFQVKKQITSAMRRIAPDGLATSIGWTTNMRNLRHVIEMRTSRHAEEEIRIVFDKVARIAQSNWPNIFCDMKINEEVDGIAEWGFQAHKV